MIQRSVFAFKDTHPPQANQLQPMLELIGTSTCEAPARTEVNCQVETGVKLGKNGKTFRGFHPIRFGATYDKIFTTFRVLRIEPQMEPPINSISTWKTPFPFSHTFPWWTSVSRCFTKKQKIKKLLWNEKVRLATQKVAFQNMFRRNELIFKSWSSDLGGLSQEWMLTKTTCFTCKGCLKKPSHPTLKVTQTLDP